MCAASKNCEKFTKNLFLRGSRSFKVIDVDRPNVRYKPRIIIIILIIIVALPLHNSFGFQLSLCACREEQFWNLLNDPRTHEPSLGECIKTYLVYPNLRGSFPSYICTV